MEELTSLQQGYYHLKNYEFSLAKKLFEKALSENEKEASCYIGMLLAENALREESQLPDLPEELQESTLFQKALSFAKGEYKNRLLAYMESQKSVLKKKEELYQTLEKKFDKAEKEEEIAELLSLCRALRDYKDVLQKKLELEQKKQVLEAEKEKKRKKKLKIVIPTTIVAVILLFTALFFFTLPKRNGVRYFLTLNGYSTLSLEEEQREVKLEEKIFGISVTGIGSKSFKDHTELETIVLPDSVYRVGQSAFNGCTSLKEVVGSEHLKQVEKKAFKECVSLKILKLDAEATVADSAFRECKKSIQVYVGNTLLLVNVEE